MNSTSQNLSMDAGEVNHTESLQHLSDSHFCTNPKPHHLAPGSEDSHTVSEPALHDTHPGLHDDYNSDKKDAEEGVASSPFSGADDQCPDSERVSDRASENWCGVSDSPVQGAGFSLLNHGSVPDLAKVDKSTSVDLSLSYHLNGKTEANLGQSSGPWTEGEDCAMDGLDPGEEFDPESSPSQELATFADLSKKQPLTPSPLQWCGMMDIPHEDAGSCSENEGYATPASESALCGPHLNPKENFQQHDLEHASPLQFSEDFSIDPKHAVSVGSSNVATVGHPGDQEETDTEIPCGPAPDSSPPLTLEENGNGSIQDDLQNQSVTQFSSSVDGETATELLSMKEMKSSTSQKADRNVQKSASFDSNHCNLDQEGKVKQTEVQLSLNAISEFEGFTEENERWNRFTEAGFFSHNDLSESNKETITYGNGVPYSNNMDPRDKRAIWDVSSEGISKQIDNNSEEEDCAPLYNQVLADIEKAKSQYLGTVSEAAVGSEEMSVPEPKHIKDWPCTFFGRGAEPGVLDSKVSLTPPNNSEAEKELSEIMGQDVNQHANILCYPATVNITEEPNTVENTRHESTRSESLQTAETTTPESLQIAERASSESPQTTEGVRQELQVIESARQETPQAAANTALASAAEAGGAETLQDSSLPPDDGPPMTATLPAYWQSAPRAPVAPTTAAPVCPECLRINSRGIGRLTVDITCFQLTFMICVVFELFPLDSNIFVILKFTCMCGLLYTISA